MKIKATIKYNDNIVEFEGDPESVLESILSFFSKVIPTFKLAREIMYSIDTKDLVNMLKPYVIVSEKGDIILTESGESLSMSNKILSVLIAAKLLKITGLRKTDFLTLYEISSLISASPKSTSSRLSELYAKGYVEKGRDEEGVKYKVSLKGIINFHRKIS